MRTACLSFTLWPLLCFVARATPSLASRSLSEKDFADHCHEDRIRPDLVIPPNIYLENLDATLHTNFSLKKNDYQHILYFCNVTINYTHTGWNDVVTINSYLPFEWNGKLLANGGFGFAAGAKDQFESIAVDTKVYMHISTNAGHGNFPWPGEPWPVVSPGNLDLALIQNFVSLSVHEIADIGKALAQKFYGQRPKYSYFRGSSSGGHQAYTVAQQYPQDFNGILAEYPALYWSRLLFAYGWPEFVMNDERYYPPWCEIEFMSNEAIKACDNIDGVTDGIISDPSRCDFDPSTLVGRSAMCNDNVRTISEKVARILRKTWDGPRSYSGEVQWAGFDIGTILNAVYGPLMTFCGSPDICQVQTLNVLPPWLTYFVMKNQTNIPAINFTHAKWDEYFHQSTHEFASVMDAVDTDLSALQKSGTKLLSWHGTTDPIVPMNGSIKYYEEVLSNNKNKNVSEFYRLFICPGGGHGAPILWKKDQGNLTPKDHLRLLVNWVESGLAPTVMRAEGSTPIGTHMERDLCPYPQKVVYKSGDFLKAESWNCIA